MDSLVVMSLFLLSGVLGIGVSWAAMSLLFLLLGTQAPGGVPQAMTPVTRTAPRRYRTTSSLFALRPE
jgi:hypothetical protein